MKRVFVILILTSALVLVGFGCSQKTATPDAEKDAGDAGRDTGIPEGWKEYRNEELGFSFWYPESLDIHVEITNFNEAPDVPDPENPWLLTKGDLLEEHEEINGKPVGHDLSLRGNRDTRSYFGKIVALTADVRAKKYLGTSQGGHLFASYTFYRGNYRVEIWVSKEPPNFVYVNEVIDNTLFNQLLEQVDQGNAPEEIQNFFSRFDQSIATIRFSE